MKLSFVMKGRLPAVLWVRRTPKKNKSSAYSGGWFELR